MADTDRKRTSLGVVLACAVVGAALDVGSAAAQQPEGTVDELDSGHLLTLGARAVVGALVSEEEGGFGGGGVLSLAVPWVEERLELEASLAGIKGVERPALGVAEIVAKVLLEVKRRFEPHLALGPVLSADFGGRNAVSGGFVVGPGLAFFLDEHWGFTADLLYRLLGGEGELEHIVTCGLGVAYRI